MKRYRIPILLFLAFIITFFLKGFIYNELIWRIIDVINYILFPISIITLFFKLKQTKENLTFIISILTFYFLINIGTHWEFIKSIVTSSLDSRLENLLMLNSTKSFVFYLWSVVLLAFLISLSGLIIKHRKIASEKYLRNKLIIVTISLVFALYFFDYGFFDSHAGWTGIHGHSFWETSGHLH